MKASRQKLYYFVFRNRDGYRIAIRAYRDYSESQARDQAESDSYRLQAYSVSRAVGDERCMVFG